MARYTESVCRLCRREGMKLFLKGDRCFKDKCAIERRNYPPGQHGRRRSQAARLRHPAAREAEGQADLRAPREPVPPDLRARGAPQGHHGREPARGARAPPRQRGVLARLRGLARAGAPARAPRPRHGQRRRRSRSRRTASPRARSSPSRRRAAINEQIKASVETARARGVPAWLDLTPETFSGRVVELPKREDIKLPIQEQLIVELYSK